MIPLDVFGSESVAADLLQLVRWRDGVSCPRCRSTERSETAATGIFSGISVGLRPYVQRQDWHDIRSLEDYTPEMVVLDLRVFAV